MDLPMEKSKRNSGCETKQHILDVALELFSRKGFSATSIREIAQTVGVRESAIYNYFKGKNDILQTLFLNYGPSCAFKNFIEKGFNPDSVEPYTFLMEIKNEIINSIYDENEQNFMKIIIIQDFTTDAAKNFAKKIIMEQDMPFMISYFKKLIDKGLIKKIEPQVLSCEFLMPLVFLKIQYLLLNCSEDNIHLINNAADNHVKFFWEAIKNEI